jgi:anti-sigma factor RsiW
MTCREFIEFLTEYRAGELSAEQRRTFDAHLAECPWCVAYLKTYEQTIRLGKLAYAEPEEAVSASVPEELVQAILAARKREPGV